MLCEVLWNSPRSWPVAVVAGVLALAAVVWLYPPQVKGLPWHWRWGLPALRAMGMLALAAALLKPAVLRPKPAEERGAVVVLVDCSRSMSVADNARTPAELVALADGLGRLAPGLRSGRASAVATQASEARPRLAEVERAWGDLEYARVSGRGVEAARDHVGRSTASFRDAVAALSRAADALGDAALRQRLASAREIPGADVPDAPARLAALRAALNGVVEAATQLQAAADEGLFRSNAEVRATCEELARSTRFSLAGEALQRPGTGLLARIGSATPVVGFAFADELAPLALKVASPAASTTRPAGQPPTQPATRSTAAAGNLELTIQPDGRRSDIAGSVRKVLELFESRDLAAVVVVSDGRQAGVDGSMTSSLGAPAAPVYAVAVAPPSGVRDVSVAGLTAPLSGFAGETATVRAEVRHVGIPERDVRVTLDAGSAGEQTQTVRLTEGRAASAEFQVKLGGPGIQRLTAAVSPVEGEASGENNVARRWVKVLSQKVKVGAFAALPGWDFQYLRNALARTPWVELDAGVLDPAAPRVRLSPEQMLLENVIVLSDVPVSALDDAQWSAVYRLVSERGGSVILLAGPSHLPVEYGSHFVASSLLPYPPELTPTWRMWPGEEPMFRLVPHADALGEPALRIGGGDGNGLQRWQTLPGFFRVLPVGRLKDSAQPMLVEASSGEPVLTQMRVGSGRAYFFGANETWRWRFAPGGDVHDRFWLQLVRQAAGEAYAARSERLALDVDKVAFDTSESVSARVRSFGGATADALKLDVIKDSKLLRTLGLTPTGGSDSGRFRARVGPVPEGDYELRLSEFRSGEAASVSLPLHVYESYENELADLSGDTSVLARLAESSGGGVYRLEQIERLAERVNADARRRSTYRELRLWDSPYLFLLVVACLTGEWAARKRLGLA